MTWGSTLKKRFDTLFNRWLNRRLPRVENITLDRQSIFTFPSRSGFAFFFVLAIIWLLAINYENNVVFAFGAWLGAMFVVSIFHGYGNLSGLTLRILSIENGFPGSRVRVEVEVKQPGRRHRDDLWLSFPGSLPQRIVLQKGDACAHASLYLDARRRGWNMADRLTLESLYPLGLIRVWTHVLLSGAGLVYPRPIAGPQTAGGGEGDDENQTETRQGTDDFAGLKEYREGESYSRIAWKQLARGQGLLTKHYVDPAADPCWLDWDSYPGLDREARLSRLCHEVLVAARKSRPYGLKLPGVSSNIGQGEIHRDRVLGMLACFEAGTKPQ